MRAEVAERDPRRTAPRMVQPGKSGDCGTIRPPVAYFNNRPAGIPGANAALSAPRRAWARESPFRVRPCPIQSKSSTAKKRHRRRHGKGRPKGIQSGGGIRDETDPRSIQGRNRNELGLTRPSPCVRNRPGHLSAKACRRQRIPSCCDASGRVTRDQGAVSVPVRARVALRRPGNRASRALPLASPRACHGRPGGASPRR